MKRLRRIAILIFCEFHLLLLLTTTDGRTFRYLRGMSYCSMDVERSPNIRVVPSAENQKGSFFIFDQLIIYSN